MSRPVRVLLVVAIAALVVAAFATGFIGTITDPDELESLFADNGVWGPLLFIGLMLAIQPFGAPGAVFMVPAALVWPWPTAAALSWIGNMGASSIAFAATRTLGQDAVQKRLPERLRKWDDRLADGGLVEVILLRVVTGQLPAADWALGVSRVRWSTFLVGTGIGIIPGILLAVIVGGDAAEWLIDRPAVLLIGTVVVVLAVAGRLALQRRRRDAHAPVE